MSDIAYSIHYRPTKAGLYFVTIPLPGGLRMRLSDFQQRFEDKIELPEGHGVDAGMLVWDDNGVERPLSAIAAKAHIEKGARIPSVKWVRKVAAIGEDGVVDSYGYYIHLHDDPPVLPGLKGAHRTDFDKDGNLLQEVDVYGHRISGSQLDAMAASTASMGAWSTTQKALAIGAVGILAVAGGGLLASLFLSGYIAIKGLLIALALVGLASSASIYFVSVSEDKKGAKSLVQQAKDAAKTVVKGVSAAARWTAGILALIAAVKILDIVD